jgi:DNA-directed RNA polymerase subunit RPC12/RpoP
MAKRVELTEQIMEYVRTKCGPDVDFNQLAFYQARGISTEPLSQDTLFNKGTLSRNALVDMQSLINDPMATVTVQAMHNTSVLPTGKVIHAELVDEVETGHSALYTLFAVSTEHQDIINKIDNGIIDEVSYGFLPKKILCSECGKDFRDDDVSFLDLIEHRCPDCGAIMGKEGAHVIIPSVELVSELSLVTRGAAKHAKILDKVYQMAMSEENTSVINLTKQEVRNDLLKINLCSTISKEVDMNSEDIKAAVLAATEPLTEELKTMQSTLASLGEEKKALEAAKDEAEKAGAALKEENATLSQEKSELESALAEAKEKANEIKAAFDAEIQKVLVAAGLSENIPEDLEGKMELLNKSHLILSAIPVDGVAHRADHLKATAEKRDFSAFKVK